MTEAKTLEHAFRSPSPPPELGKLLQATDSGAKSRAWRAFTNEFSGLLLHTARTLTNDYDAAMDRYTYVLERLAEDDYRRLRSYTPDGTTKFSTWLVVVARRLCVDYSRAQYGRKKSDQPDDASVVRKRLVDLIAAEIDPSQLSKGGTPESQLRSAELKSKLQQATSGLDPEDQMLLALRFEEESSAREIREIMGFPTQFHVYRKIKAVLKQLRSDLEQEGVDDPVP